MLLGAINILSHCLVLQISIFPRKTLLLGLVTAIFISNCQAWHSAGFLTAFLCRILSFVSFL